MASTTLEQTEAATMAGAPAHGFSTAPPESLPRRLLRSTENGLYWSGAANAYARFRVHSGAVILNYHSVLGPGESRWIDPCNAVEADAFEAQIRFLGRHRRVVPLSNLVSDLQAGRPIPRGTVVITFDDGYLDILQVAAPILERFRLPATLYLPTGYIQRGETQWIDRLYTLFRYRTRNELDLSGLVGGDTSLNGDRVSAMYRLLNDRLIAGDPADRERLLSEILRQFRPSASPPRLTMTWDEVRALRDRHPSIEIGVHTVEHTDLSSCTRDEAARQISGCIDDVERELGRRPEHFSFPYDRDTPEVRGLVVAAGLRSASSSSGDVVVRNGSDPFSLPRASTCASLTRLRFITSGAYPGLPLLLFRRA